MIFTLFYLYATIMKWRRLDALRKKIKGTLNHKNALLLCTGGHVQDENHKRCPENLLFDKEGRLGCIVVPKQRVNLNQWLYFPEDRRCFPLHIGTSRKILDTQTFYILLRANLDTYKPHQRQLIYLEKFGELVAWRASDFLEIIFKTDLHYLTRLMDCFTYNFIDINHDLEVLKIETIEVEGTPLKTQYNQMYSLHQQQVYSLTGPDWKSFICNLKKLYSKINENSNPKITIENGTAERRAEILEVKTIKKRSDKVSGLKKVENPEVSQNKDKPVVTKNKLEVHSHTSHKKRDKLEEKKHKPKEIVQKFTKLEASKPKPEINVKSSEENSPKVNDETKKLDENKLMVVKKVDKVAKKDDKVAKKDDKDVNKEEKKVKRKSIKSHSEVAQCIAGAKNLQRQNATSANSKETSPNRTAKPPNILVYADSLIAKESVKSVLKTIINKEKYTVYDLPVNTSTNLWDSSTILVIVCGNVTPNLTNHLLDYLVNGGQLLCLCSDLLYSVLQTFSTAEVREHELVRFTYGEWKRVKMMHHIFCYQASPAKKQFSKDSDQSNHSNGSSPVAPRTPSIVEIQHGGLNYTIQVQVLGAEETWQTPSLLLATVKNSMGKAIFSQVHLEVDPTQYQEDENKYAALKDSDQARLEILKHILSTHLEIDCKNTNLKVEYTPAYLLGRHDQKLDLLKNCQDIKENKLEMDDITLEFFGKGVEHGPASYTRLPVLYVSCPSNFSTLDYFENLKTEKIGRLVLYSDVLSSSQNILKKKLGHGFVVIPKMQSEGRGRSNNEWISPDGCAMFSVQLHVDLSSPLGQHVSLLQHLVMLAIVSSVTSIPGSEDLDIGIKWPNDLYAYSNTKIGGLVASSTIEKDVAVINIGCGINLYNCEPTISLNEVILKHNEVFHTKIEFIQYEEFFARVFNETERILNIVQSGDMDYFFKLYYANWLHKDAVISVQTKNGNLKDVVVTGIDKHGFLLVKSQDGSISSVHPDGNSFDMLKGLIASKIT